MTATTESKQLLPSTVDIDDVDSVAINRNKRTSILKKIVGVGVSGLFCTLAVVSHQSKYPDSSLTKSELSKLVSYAPLTTSSDSTCATGLIKAYSVDRIWNNCGETCLNEGDFAGLKKFEKGFTKAGSVVNPCQVAGYDTFKKVTTHGDPFKIIAVSTLNMFSPTKK
mmetsp:Transcript_23739/g.25368  ORF Transcript_23739/g.25368 Transcript_23739/m.25368 type:complete len:167 (+) Transcript_23739:93-593(+)